MPRRKINFSREKKLIINFWFCNLYYIYSQITNAYIHTHISSTTALANDLNEACVTGRHFFFAIKVQPQSRERTLNLDKKEKNVFSPNSDNFDKSDIIRNVFFACVEKSGAHAAPYSDFEKRRSRLSRYVSDIF